MSSQRQTSRLLINEAPLQVLPSLAAAIGLNEAIVLQQIHFLVSTHHALIADNSRWICRTMDEWAKEFIWWNIKTVKRVFASLRKRNLIVTGKFNENKWDHTLWYRIDYEALEALTPSVIVPVDKDNLSLSESDKLSPSDSPDLSQSSLLDNRDKKDSSSPVVQSEVPKPKVLPKPRERNPVFDAIALGSFSMPVVPKGKGGRVASLCKAVTECSDQAKLDTLGTDLTAMYQWYKRTYPQLSPPAAVETICKYLAEYRQSNPSSEIKYVPVEHDDYVSPGEAA